MLGNSWERHRLVLELTHSGYTATTISASEVRASWFQTVSEVQACVTVSGGAITGVIVPPLDLAPEVG